jgi:hypothetical protein
MSNDVGLVTAVDHSFTYQSAQWNNFMEGASADMAE